MQINKFIFVLICLTIFSCSVDSTRDIQTSPKNKVKVTYSGKSTTGITINN